MITLNIVEEQSLRVCRLFRSLRFAQGLRPLEFAKLKDSYWLNISSAIRMTAVGRVIDQRTMERSLVVFCFLSLSSKTDGAMFGALKDPRRSSGAKS